MILNDAQGHLVQLDPVGYEFSSEAMAPDWIVVDGMADGEGGRWRFRGAPLVPIDCTDLSVWLDRAATGGVGITGGEDDPSLTFGEPSLAFSVASYDSDLTRIRVHLTHLFAPPWLDIDDVTNTYSYFVELAMAPSDLRAASVVWRDQSSPFLRRR